MLGNSLIDKEEYKKEHWIEFRLNKELLTAYTIHGSFLGELEATLELLAYENNCDINDIKVNNVYR